MGEIGGISSEPITTHLVRADSLQKLSIRPHHMAQLLRYPAISLNCIAPAIDFLCWKSAVHCASKHCISGVIHEIAYCERDTRYRIQTGRVGCEGDGQHFVVGKIMNQKYRILRRCSRIQGQEKIRQPRTHSEIPGISSSAWACCPVRNPCLFVWRPV